MIHFHKVKKWTLYIHTISWILIPIKKENFTMVDLFNNYLIEFTAKDIYWNEYTIDKNKIDIAFDDKWIYHNFHNEEFFNSINNTKWE